MGEKKIYIGGVLSEPPVPTYEERISERIPLYMKFPPAKLPIEIDGRPLMSAERILAPRMV